MFTHSKIMCVRRAQRWYRYGLVALGIGLLMGGWFPQLGRGWGQWPSMPLPRFGVDDGFACVLFYGSDIGGNLEPCG